MEDTSRGLSGKARRVSLRTEPKPYNLAWEYGFGRKQVISSIVGVSLAWPVVVTPPPSASEQGDLYYTCSNLYSRGKRGYNWLQCIDAADRNAAAQSRGWATVERRSSYGLPAAFHLTKANAATAASGHTTITT